MDTSTRPQQAIIHGAGGAIGTSVAEEFARRVPSWYSPATTSTLSGRPRIGIRPLASAPVHVAEVDAYEQTAVNARAAAVLEAGARIDVMLNAAGIPLIQGVPPPDLTLGDALAPATSGLRTQFITTQAAGRHMVLQGSGTILPLSASPARMSIAGVGGFAAACSAVEALTRTFAAEFGRSGVSVVCMRPHHIQDTLGTIPDLPMPIAEFT